ncbi:hypothetical protein [Lentzea sp. NPDC060358]|uniref:hypothetical protein n=1 Tax=Lentzea sp. NPDC060358 TaxID=3347103 RepID=UPI00366965CA
MGTRFFKTTAVIAAVLGGVLIGAAGPAAAFPVEASATTLAGNPGGPMSALGTHYTQFDDRGRPVAGYTDDGVTFTIEWFGENSSIWRYSNGCTVWLDDNGNVTRIDC